MCRDRTQSGVDSTEHYHSSNGEVSVYYFKVSIVILWKAYGWNGAGWFSIAAGEKVSSTTVISSTDRVYLCRKGDILFSMLVGTGAYFIYERDHPRPEGKSLMELLNRRRMDIIQEREALRQERLDKLRQKENQS